MFVRRITSNKCVKCLVVKFNAIHQAVASVFQLGPRIVRYRTYIQDSGGSSATTGSSNSVSVNSQVRFKLEGISYKCNIIYTLYPKV